jgi:hypothetical protein
VLGTLRGLKAIANQVCKGCRRALFVKYGFPEDGFDDMGGAKLAESLSLPLYIMPLLLVPICYFNCAQVHLSLNPSSLKAKLFIACARYMQSCRKVNKRQQQHQPDKMSSSPSYNQDHSKAFLSDALLNAVYALKSLDDDNDLGLPTIVVVGDTSVSTQLLYVIMNIRSRYG